MAALPSLPGLLWDSRRPLRRREFDQLVEFGAFHDERVELLAGVLIEMSPQGAAHSNAVAKLAALLIAALGSRAEIRSHSPLALSDESEPEPDVAVVPPGDYSRELPHTAFLVVEVADSSLRTDRQVKSALYAQAGIPEYWIVNLVQGAVEVHREPIDGRYAKELRFTRADTVDLASFPDARIAVDRFVPAP
jgi:Uma2 family endonuclease